MYEQLDLSEKRNSSGFIDLTGQRFGRLLVLRRAPVRYSRSDYSFWECACDCGAFVPRARGYTLRSGLTQSCGCYNKEQTQKTHRRGTGEEVAVRHFYRVYQAGARKNQRAFSIPLDTFTNLITLSCAYCGTKPKRYQPAINQKTGERLFRTHSSERALEIVTFVNGLDRVDSSKDYTPENVVPCCKTCNIAKHNMTEQEFIAWIHRAAAFLSAKANTEKAA